jgi:hypothetical protein
MCPLAVLGKSVESVFPWSNITPQNFFTDEEPFLVNVNTIIEAMEHVTICMVKLGNTIEGSLSSVLFSKHGGL